MCGRFTLNKNINQIIYNLNCTYELADRLWNPSYNIAPKQFSPVLIHKNKLLLKLMCWGINNISKNNTYTIINSRFESLQINKFYNIINKFKRCIVIADGYYEWAKNKQPYYITRIEKKPMYIAGIWKESKLSNKKKSLNFSIITKQAISKINTIHNRMPLILSKNYINEWLDPKFTIFNNLSFLENNISYLNATKVSNYVNFYKNNCPKCIEPIHN